ncbi:MAG: hypothetical protein ACKOTB_18000, partial [Planctomycetia bacterium]
LHADGFGHTLPGDAHATLLVSEAGEGAVTRERAHALTALATAAADRIDLVDGPSGLLVRVSSREPLANDTVAAARGIATRVHVLAPVLPVLTPRGVRVPFSSAAELVAVDAGRGLPLWRHAVAYEMQRGDLAEDDVLAMMLDTALPLRRPAPRPAFSRSRTGRSRRRPPDAPRAPPRSRATSA